MNKKHTNYRFVKDYIGKEAIPESYYYGIQTAHAVRNFQITGLKMNTEMIESIIQIKKTAAITNFQAGTLDQKRFSAIVHACDNMLQQQLYHDFVVDPIQGGAGTSMNMNANEVIANRANANLRLSGIDMTVHPNDHVNLAQSTNDVIPTAGKMTLIKLLAPYKKTLSDLVSSLEEKANEFDSVIKMGRTQLQDAVPIRLGQEFCAYAIAVKRQLYRLEVLETELQSVNLGGTAIGTCLNASPYYIRHIVPNLTQISGIKLHTAENLIDSTQNVDVFAALSNALKCCAITLSKIANDLRLMSSGPSCGFGEITLPAKQSGSSIMPGKINPVIPEVVNQVAFYVIGNDTTITMAVEAGQLELNAFCPVIFFSLFHSIQTLTHAIQTLIVNCIQGITANSQHCSDLVENSSGIITALCPYIGYTKATSIIQRSKETGFSIQKLLRIENLIDEKSLHDVLDPVSMTSLCQDNSK